MFTNLAIVWGPHFLWMFGGNLSKKLKDFLQGETVNLAFVPNGFADQKIYGCFVIMHIDVDLDLDLDINTDH